MVDRKLPHSIEAEESVLGSLLIDGDAIRFVENKLKPPDFYRESNRFIYNACLELRSRREKIDQITVAQELSRQKQLDDCGGTAYLSHLIANCPTSFDIEYYADIVYRLSVSRQIISFSGKISDLGYMEEPDVNRTMNQITTTLNDFKKDIIRFDELISPKDAGNILMDMIMEYRNPSKRSISYGFLALDNITSGISPEFIVLGARPSVGKTELMLNIMINVVECGYKVLFCSAEMGIKSIMERHIARDLHLNIKDLRRNKTIDDDMEAKLMELAGKISEQQIYYMPRGISSQDIHNEALKLKNSVGLDMVFVDYLQILNDCWQMGRENKSVLVGRASKVLKSIVNDLDIPVFCASQLSREIERRSEDTKKPTLADLKESGEIEQDSDVVFLLWRDIYNQEEEVRNILEIEMAKNRQLGNTPMIQLVWNKQYHRYEDLYSDIIH
jgi:replicative DNA helicase